MLMCLEGKQDIYQHSSLLFYSCHFIVFFNYFFYSVPNLKVLLGLARGRMLEKSMAPHSSTPAWKIPWTGKPGRLQSMGSLRVGQD